MRVSAKTLARAVAPGLIVLLVATCDLATAPGPAGTIALSFGPESTVVLGTVFEPTVSVTLDGKAVDQPRVRYVSSDPASVEVYDDGKYLLAVRRDTVTVWAELESSLSSASPPRVSRQFRVIVDSVSLDRRGDTLTSLGETATFSASVFDGNDDPVSVSDIKWISSDATIATVTQQGLVTALKSGEATVSAIVDNDTARATIKVEQVLERFSFSRTSVAFDVIGTNTTITATGLDARGNAIAGLAPAGWFSGAQAIATVNGGVVTAIANGTTFVRAVRGSVEDTVPVIVNQVATSVTISGDALVPIRSLGDVARLSALALDGGNIPVSDAEPTWSSTAPLVASVHSTTGVVTALAVGQSLVIARLDGAADTVTIVVTNEPAEIVVLPGSATLTSVYDTLRVTVTVRNALGDPIASAPVAIRSTDELVLRVLTSLDARAEATGNALLIAQSGAVSDTVQVTVFNAPATLDIVPPQVTLTSVGDSIRPAVVVTNARGAVLGSSAVAWTSDEPTIARVTIDGIIIARDSGTTRIRAQSPLDAQRRDSVVVIVTNAPASIVASRERDTLSAVGRTRSYTAEVRNARGGLLLNYPVTWSSNATDVATASGTVTANVVATGVGTAMIIGTAGTVSDAVELVVRNDPVSLEVMPGTATLSSVGDTLRIRHRALNDLGDSVPALLVLWQSPDPGLVEVFPDGRAIALAAGTARVVGSYAGLADTSLVTITNTPHTVDIVPTNATMASINDSLTPAVDIRNARGGILPRDAVVWSTEDLTIARVTQGGIIIAKDTGQIWIRIASPIDAAKKDSILVTVTNAPATIITDGSLDTLTSIGQTLAFSDTVRNARGALIANYPTVWRSTNTNAITVSTEGLVAVVGYGLASVIAEAGTVSDTLTIVAHNATKLYVDNAVVVSSRFGTLKRPFDRIQDAVNTADAGDTILIRRGSRPYAEMPSLSRRLTVLGDSTAFKANGRNPAFLPQIAHDTGSAGIRVFTTAPAVIRYLAIKHTLDGAAIDADGSDMVIEWVYVNQPVSGTSRIGRGISIRNSPSGTSVQNVRIRNVRGYGIRLQDVSGASIVSDSISGIDSIAGSQPGSGIYVVGGGNAYVYGNVVRAAQGPQINVTGATSPGVYANDLASQNTLIRYDAVQGSPRILDNILDLRYQAGDDGQSSAQDDRAGVQVLNSTPPPRMFISRNTFTGQKTSATSLFGPIDGVFVSNSGEWFISDNRFISTRYTIRTRNAQGFIQRNVADTAASFLLMEGTASLVLFGDTVRTMSSCIQSYTGGPHSIYADSTLFQNCTTGFWAALHVHGTGNSLTLRRSRIEIRRRETQAISFSDGFFELDSSTIVVTDSAVAGPGSDTTYGAVDVTSGSIVRIRDTRIAGFGQNFGLRTTRSGSGFFLDIQRSTITRNRAGMHLGSSPNFGTISANEVFDNRDAGLFVQSLATLPAGFWWGDSRGPRGTTAAATGDSITGGPVTVSSAAAPFRPGSVAASIVRVRGSGQSATRGTVAPKALTVRVTDATGRPVSGVSVTFTRLLGGGSFGGAATFTVATNGDGLAEATLTLGAAAGTNTVTATGTTVSIGTVNFTLTGT